ncbi:hypothetical protein OCU04_010882 [Sclerotinia nivalis]|uniref:Uncharacterized protein n=1 Tax=Sclerotinia nivalis TaxID=352851 RepID=A0A9X0AD19_9HELO|nr:hypothetical protein OCU04_010882 [Sclerotinia nivalis]
MTGNNPSSPMHESEKNHPQISPSPLQYSFNDASVANQRNRVIIRSLRNVFGNALSQFALVWENEHDWLIRNGNIIALAMRLNAQAITNFIATFVDDTTMRPESQVNRIREYIRNMHSYEDAADLTIRRFVKLADDLVHYCMRAQPPPHTYGILEEFTRNTPILTRVWRWSLVDMRLIISSLETAIDFVDFPVHMRNMLRSTARMCTSKAAYLQAYSDAMA